MSNICKNYNHGEKMKKTLLLIIAVLLLATGGYYYFSLSEKTNDEYDFAELTRGDIFSTITSTGTLEAVTKVEVGTQVSGKIEKIYYDYNDEVNQGQLLALLDTTFLSASVNDAEASLSRMEALQEEADKKFELAKTLFEKQMISEIDYISAKTAAKTADANLQSSRSSLERAKTNLQYAFIKSPITGTIISRNIEEGQTVAASLQAPTLFTIANDLSNMEILASVDESDIGEIKKGQRVKFTVPAYWDKEFEGYVRQIRLQPNIVSNVVSYTVVVNAKNDESLLLPGMTATLDFYISEAVDVIKIPASALNFRPSAEAMQSFFEKRMAAREKDVDSTRGRARFNFQGKRDSGQNNGVSTRNNNRKQIWYFYENGELEMMPVQVGIDDGKFYELVRGRNIVEGMKVIVSQLNTSKTKTENQPQFGPPRGMRPF